MRAVLPAFIVALAVLPAAAPAAAPTTVNAAGSFGSEAGCAGDWDPGCAATRLALDGDDGVWQRAFALPAGSYTYRIAIDGGWTESYGRGGRAEGADLPLVLAAPGTVRLYYDPESHWAADSASTPIATMAGSFQSELGCPADWAPDCLRSWLEDPDGDGVLERLLPAGTLPPGRIEGKAALGETWDESYGGPAGANLVVDVPAGARVLLRFDTATRIPSIEADATPPTIAAVTVPAAPDGRAGWFRGTPTLGFTVLDGESTVRARVGCDAAPVAVDGVTTRTCTATSLGGTASASGTVRRDATAPTAACPAAPALLLRARGAGLVVHVADATSGPAAATVAVPADTRAVGRRVVRVTARDVAGNATSTSCAYVIRYAVRGLAPAEGRSVSRGRPLRFAVALGDAAGRRLPRAAARALARRCGAVLRVDGVRRAPSCLHLVRDGRLAVAVRGRPALALGKHVLALEVRAPDGTVVAAAARTVRIIRG